MNRATTTHPPVPSRVPRWGHPGGPARGTRVPLIVVLRRCLSTSPVVRERAARALRKVVRGMVFKAVDGRREVVEELAQDRMAWLFSGGIDKLLRKAGQMNDSRRFAGYFRTTIVRGAREPLRRHAHKREVPLRVSDSRPGDPATRIADDIVTLTRILGHQRAFWEAFDDLPAAHRQVLQLEFAHCLGAIDRAGMREQLGLETDVALRSRIHRARACFHGLLKERGMDVEAVLAGRYVA